MSYERIGWFADLPHGDAGAPELALSINQIDQEQRSPIADYLDSGIVLAETLRTEAWDALSSTRPAIGPLRTMTDGLFIWPSDLGFYVRNYGAALPDSLLLAIEENKGKIPALSPDDLDQILAGEILVGRAAPLFWTNT